MVKVYQPEVMLPIGGFQGVVLDFDDTITNPFIQQGRMKGARIHDVSRILTAREMGIMTGNDYLSGLTEAQSKESYENAAEPTLEGSIAYLFYKAGIFESHEDYDRYDERLHDFAVARSRLHKRLLKDHVSLNRNVEKFMQTVRDTTEYGLAIASMATLEEIDVVFDRFGLYQYVSNERIISREMVSKPKPHREVNDLAFHTLRTPGFDYLQRQRIMGIDDSRGGLKSIHDARLFPVAIATNLPAYKFKDSAAQLVISGFQEALQLLDLSRGGVHGSRTRVS